MTRDKVTAIVDILDGYKSNPFRTLRTRGALGARLAHELHMPLDQTLGWVYEMAGLNWHIGDDRNFLIQFLLDL